MALQEVIIDNQLVPSPVEMTGTYQPSLLLMLAILRGRRFGPRYRVAPLCEKDQNK
jgi:hypothetical protein